MKLSNVFTTIFDKAADKGHAEECENQWEVKEQNASMRTLYVNAQGVFLGFTHDLVKCMSNTTSEMSSNLEDKDCDGIAFLNDDSEEEHLLFVELKSNFDIKKIIKAFHQITMSFIKIHMWLSLCKNYNLDKIKVHFITACKCYKDEEQELSVKLRISEAQQLEEESFETKFLKPLLDNNNIKVKLSSFYDIQNLPFHDCICEKEVNMYLQMTQNHSDSSTSINIL